jgi:hypothetical protein
LSEGNVQQQIRIAAARNGTPLLRNNSGACLDQNGRMIRYGLGNDSAKLNKSFKSSDLIGIWPVTVTPEMVGQTLGVFFAVEVKAPGWKFRQSDKRAVAQQNFLTWVSRHGGVAMFATKETEIWK